MRIVRNILLLILSISAIIACSSSDDLVGNWQKSQQFSGKARLGASTFTINGRPYVGFGLDKDNYERNDFYEFTPGEIWVEVAPFPGKPRYGAFAFSDGRYGYAGLGYSQNLSEGGAIAQEEYFDDFWQFDPEGVTVIDAKTYTGKWTETTKFPGKKRKFGVSFFVDGKGYIGTGIAEGKDGDLNDFYSFDPTSKVWKLEESKGDSRQGAVAWVIGKSAYVAAGANGSASTGYVNEVWKFTPGASSPETRWIALDPLKDLEGRSYDNGYREIQRSYGVAFVVGKEEDQSARVYLTLGNPSNLTCWEFNPYWGEKGVWEEVTSFPVVGGVRQQAVAFTMDNVGYVTVGGSSVRAAEQRTYKFFPGVDDNDYDND